MDFFYFNDSKQGCTNIVTQSSFSCFTITRWIFNLSSFNNGYVEAVMVINFPVNFHLMSHTRSTFCCNNTVSITNMIHFHTPPKMFITKSSSFLELPFALFRFAWNWVFWIYKIIKNGIFIWTTLGGQFLLSTFKCWRISHIFIITIWTVTCGRNIYFDSPKLKILSLEYLYFQIFKDLCLSTVFDDLIFSMLSVFQVLRQCRLFPHKLNMYHSFCK